MPRYDAILLLGLKLREDGSAQDELTDRVRLAACCYREGLAERIIACGGITGAGVSEAQVMVELLRKCGVPDEVVWQEDQSKITYENVRNALNMLNGSRRVLLVTSDYHLPRARITVLREGGFWPAGRAVKTPLGWEKICRWKVELYALVDYLFFWGRRDDQRPVWAEKLKDFLLRRNGIR